jgi:pimeloyl-ACP methyl ester carboxylesterase
MPHDRPRAWLLLRGLVREKRHWGAFPAELEAQNGVTTLCLDLPGTGTECTRPSPKTIAAIVDDIRERFLAVRGDQGPWGIFAVSLGGMVALDWAARYPDDFTRCVVSNTSAADVSSPLDRFRPSAWPTIARAGAASAATRERRILDLTSNHLADRAGLADQHARYAVEQPIGWATFARQILAASRSRLPAAIPVPVTVLVSDGDRLVDPTCSRRIAERLGAPLRVHPDGGHDLPLDAPAWVIEQLRLAASPPQPGASSR